MGKETHIRFERESASTCTTVYYAHPYLKNNT